MELKRRNTLIYGLLLGVWLLVVGWQVEEHHRVQESAKTDLRNRSNEIANTLSAVIRALRFRSGVLQDRLEPVLDENELSFYFKDATSGKTTYPPGRFLDADVPKTGEIELDFNKAYNPPCAFTAYATCPLPPKQNVLTTAIEAGEKNYGHHE